MQSRRNKTQQNSTPAAANTKASSTNADPTNKAEPGDSSANDDDIEMSNEDAALRLDQDVSLPKTTITQLIQEKCPEDVKISSTSKDMIIAMSMSFIANLAAKANTICADHNKKTIVAEHVFEAMHAAKQSHMLGPIFSSSNYAKLSYAKQRELAMKKVIELESKRSQKYPAQETNKMTAEEQIKEQERIFEQANRQMELEKQQKNSTFQLQTSPDQELVQQPPTAIEVMREQIMNIDFEAVPEINSDNEIMFTFDE